MAKSAHGIARTNPRCSARAVSFWSGNKKNLHVFPFLSHPPNDITMEAEVEIFKSKAVSSNVQRNT